MQHTTKYNFNLIETSDAFGPEALNANTQAVEDKLAALEAADAALQATASADKSQLQAAIQTAQNAAQSAQNAANAAQSTANTARAEAAVLPYKVGSYKGNGSTQTIELGFRPSFVIISGSFSGTSSTSSALYNYNLFTAGSLCTEMIRFTNTGFTVIWATSTASSTGMMYPQLNASNHSYNYIAFR